MQERLAVSSSKDKRQRTHWISLEAFRKAYAGPPPCAVASVRSSLLQVQPAPMAHYRGAMGIQKYEEAGVDFGRQQSAE